MNCTECKESLVAYLDGVLDATQRHAVDRHLEDCLSCRTELRELTAVQDRLFADGKVVARDNVEEHVMNRIIREQNVRLKAAPVGASLAIRRFLMKNPITKISVAAAVIIAVGIGIHSLGSGTPTFAAVIKSIMEAHTATFKVVVHTEGQPVETLEGEFMDPGLERQTTIGGSAPGKEIVLITDYVQGKALALVPSLKSAMRMEAENWSHELQAEKLNQFEELRRRIKQAQESPDQSVEYLGESQIDGREAIGYRFAGDDTGTTIWADASSLLPLQIEHVIRRSGNKIGSVVMMDIQFNVSLDPADFSMDVPPGYTLNTMQLDASAPREVDLIEALRVWTKATGKFPAELKPMSGKELGDVLSQDKSLHTEDAKGFGDPQVQARMVLVMKVMRGFMFMKSLSSNGIDWHYAGAGVVLGDAARPVFWYRPQGSQTYRVIYADLSVKDVPEESLP
jgi:hypothetical protein